MFIILFDVCYQLLKKLGGKKDEYFCFLNLVMFCGVIIKKKKNEKKHLYIAINMNQTWKKI